MEIGMKIRALSIPEQSNTIFSLLHADISRRNSDSKVRHSFYNDIESDIRTTIENRSILS